MIETITIDTDEWAVVPRAKLSEALDVIQGVMQAAYDNAYLECCGRSAGGECCGNPDAAWSKEDARVMDALAPAQRELAALLAAAPRPEPVQLANPSCLEAFTAFWDDYRFKSWGANPHPQWPNNRTKENMPDQWCAIGKPYAWEAWRACWETAPRPVPTVTDPVAWRRFDGEGGFDYTSDPDIAQEWIDNERGKLPKFVDPLGLATMPQVDPVEDRFAMRERQHIMITSQAWDRGQGTAFADGWNQCAYHYGIRSHGNIAAQTPRPEPKCATCNDHGMIGGPSFREPDEGGVPCPDCSDQRPVPTNSVYMCPDHGSGVYVGLPSYPAGCCFVCGKRPAEVSGD